MTANVIVTVEREFEDSPDRVFRAWTEPSELCQWRGSPGWHVEQETLSGELQLGGRHRHVKIRDDDPSARVGTEGVYTEFFPPEVFVSREIITGDAGIDEHVPLELRVEFTRTGRKGTLIRVIQGPYEQPEAEKHGEGWEREMGRLSQYLQDAGRGATQ